MPGQITGKKAHIPTLDCIPILPLLQREKLFEKLIIFVDKVFKHS
jgi:hypothetical protein